MTEDLYVLWRWFNHIEFNLCHQMSNRSRNSMVTTKETYRSQCTPSERYICSRSIIYYCICIWICVSSQPRPWVIVTVFGECQWYGLKSSDGCFCRWVRWLNPYIAMASTNTDKFWVAKSELEVAQVVLFALIAGILSKHLDLKPRFIHS